jgi:hypothetical protein
MIDDLEFLHPYFVASKETDLDKAFEDGKQRAISTIDRQIEMLRQKAERIELITRDDYNRAKERQ